MLCTKNKIIKYLEMSIYRSRDQGPRGGAEHLARIHGTEEDKVNCPFYFKIGAKNRIILIFIYYKLSSFII